MFVELILSKKNEKKFDERKPVDRKSNASSTFIDPIKSHRNEQILLLRLLVSEFFCVASLKRTKGGKTILLSGRRQANSSRKEFKKSEIDTISTLQSLDRLDVHCSDEVL